MSQSTTPQGDRAVLCQKGDELAEFAALFSELAMPVQECTDAVPDPSTFEGARLAVVSGRSLVDSGQRNLSGWPRTIVVIDDASKTLVAHLSRIGAAMVIRRPIHPRALRLLLLHEIYRGPERRVRRRVLIGQGVRISSGLFKPRALLLELSLTGARLEVANPPKVGSKLRILLGKEMTKGRPLRLHAKVVRCMPSSNKTQGGSEIGVAILDAPRHVGAIRAILDRFALGPAKWTAGPTADARSATASVGRPADRKLPRVRSGAPSPGPAMAGACPPTRVEKAATIDRERTLPDSRIAGATPAPKTREDTTPAPPRVTHPAPTPVEPDPPSTTVAPDPSEEIPERRGEVRVAYDERVVALDEEAARVLVGRDLSSGGMRIASTPVVPVGCSLRVALHGEANADPLVVVARALRDDGEEGIALAFEDLSDEQRERLEGIIAEGLPIHASDGDFADADLDDGTESIGESIVVAEMLDSIDASEPA